MSEVVGEAVLRFSTDRSAVDSGLADVEKDSAKTGGKSGGAFAGAFKKAVKVGAIGGAITASIGVALFKVGSQFDALADTIQVSTGKSGAALQGLTDDANAVARQVPVAFDAIGPVISTLNQKLGLAGKPLQTIAAQFLDLQHITGEAVDVDAITGALNLFQVQSKDTSGVLDELFRVTQETGIGFNDLGSILGRAGPALQQFGFSIEDSASLIGSLSKAGIDPSRTLGTLTRALSTFAKAGKDPQKALSGTVEQIDALIKSGDQAGAIDLAGKVFGTRGATQFVTAIKSGRLDMEALTKVTENNKNTIIGTEKATRDFGERLTLLKNRAFLELEPVATRVFNAVGDAMEKINTSGALPAIADGARDLVRELSPLVERGLALAQKVLPRIRDVAGEVVPKVLDLASALADDVVSAVGNVLDVVGPLVEEAAGLGEAFLTGGALEKVVGILEGLGDVLVSVTGFLADHDTAVRALLITVGTAIALWQAWNLAITVVSTVTKAFTAVQAALNFVLSANPIGLIVIGLAALVAGLIYAYKHSARFREIVDGIGHTVASVFGGIIQFFKEHWVVIVSLIGGPIVAVAIQVIKHFDDIRAGVGKAIDFITGIPGKIADLAGAMKDAGKEFVAGLFHGITGAAGKAGDVVADIAGDVFDAIKDMINDAIDLINSGIPDSIGKGFAKIDLPNNPIPHLARGTQSWRGGWSWVGEEGPELVNMPRGATVFPATESAAMAGGGGGVVVQFTGPVQPHNYNQFIAQAEDAARLATLSTRRPINQVVTR